MGAETFFIQIYSKERTRFGNKSILIHVDHNYDTLLQIMYTYLFHRFKKGVLRSMSALPILV